MNKFAIVTGASRGIGFAVSEYLAKNDYNLALVSRNEDHLQDAKKHLLGINSKLSIEIYPHDLAEAHLTYDLVKSILDDKEQINLLFNGAGVYKAGTTEISIDDYLKTQSVNMNAVFSVTKAVVEKMRKQGHGYIMNLSALAGIRGLKDKGAYCASKFALVGYSESLFYELIDAGIKVTAICPSIVASEMSKEFGISDIGKIQVSDVIKTVDYLLNLSGSALINKINVRCRVIESAQFPKTYISKAFV